MRRTILGIGVLAELIVSGVFVISARPRIDTYDCTQVHRDSYAGLYTDPIVWPGFNAVFTDTTGPHRHYFFGATAIHESSDGPDLLTGGTTCATTTRNAYWSPALQQVRSPAFPIAAVRASVLIHTPVRSVPAPTGLMAVSHRHSWVCPSAGSVLPVGCPDGFAYMRVVFQNCWNGVDLRGRSFGPSYTQPHLTYALRGRCPSGFIRIPKLTVTFAYDLRPSNSQTEPLTVRVGPGNTTGSDPFGGHADVIWAG